MNDCTRYQVFRIEVELDGGSPPAGGALPESARRTADRRLREELEGRPDPHCDECGTAARAFVRILRAGRELGRAEPPAAAVEAGRRRLLEMLAAGGGRGFVALLALAGGVFLAGLAAAGGDERRPAAPGAVLTMAAGTAGAAVALAGDSASRDRPGSRSNGGAVSGPRALSLRAGRGMMGACELSPAFC